MADATLPGFEPENFEGWDQRVKELNEARETRKETTTPSIFMPGRALKSALIGNQFKNRFDEKSLLGIGGGSPMYEDARRAAEEHYFGIPHDAPGSARPIYGFLRKKGESHGMDDEYGDVTVDIRHPKPGENVTTTVGDSLNNYGRYLSTKGNDMMSEEEEERGLKELEERNPEPLTPGHHGAEDPDSPKNRNNPFTVEYREIQWHDRPTPREDITAVHIDHDLGSDRSGYPETRIQRKLSEMKNKAAEFRTAGLPQSTPVTGHIEFSHYQPGLFDDLPEAHQNRWHGEWQHETIEKNF